MVHRIPLTKARTDLRQAARWVHRKQEYIILEEDGAPIAGMMDIDEMEDFLDLQNPKLKKQIDEGYQAYLRGECRDADEFLGELKSEGKKSVHKRTVHKRK